MSEIWLPLALVLASQTLTDTTGLRLGVGLTYPDCYPLEAMQMEWYYNWASVGVPGCNVEFVPMHYQGWTWPDQEYAPVYLLMFNEANHVPQGAISPQQGAIEWQQAEAEFPGTRLVGPSVTPWGQQWLDDWYAAYQEIYQRPPRLDVAAVHCYFPAWTTCRDWIEAQWQWFSVRGAQELWLTEVSFLPCWYEQREAETVRQGQLLLDWMRTQDYIGRVAWFASHPVAYGAGVWWPDGCQTPLADTRDLTVYGRWLQEEIEQ